MRCITILSNLLALLTSVAFSALAVAQDNRILVAEDAPKRVLIPSAQNGGDKLGGAWHAVDFDDSVWRAGRGGVGLEARGEDYKPFISIDVQEQMYDKQTSAFIRIPFIVEGEVPALLLRVRYDDGFVAYLNGEEVVRANFTGEPSWNSNSENRMVNDESNLPFESFNISASLGALKQGKNLLAVHGMQDRPNSSDFLICMQLLAGAEAPVAQATSQTQAAQSAAAAQVVQPPQSQAATLVEVPKSEEPVSEEWPQWRGPHGNGKSGVKGIKKDWSGGLEKLWEKGDLCQGEGNTSTWSAPSILGDKMVIPGRHGDKDVIFCFNAETGEPLWKREYATVPDNRQGGGSRYGSGSFASPNIDGDRAYTFGGWGDLACWKLENGEQIWKKNVRDLGGISANFGFTSSPLVYRDKVIVHGGGDVMIVAFDKMTGQIIWKCSWDDDGSGRPGYGSPMVANLGGRDQILTSVTAAGRRRGRHGPGRVAGLDPEHGVVLWEVPWWCFYELFAVPVVESPIAVVTTGMRSGSMALKIDRSGATQIWENWGKATVQITTNRTGLGANYSASIRERENSNGEGMRIPDGELSYTWTGICYA
jgi:outer membrane protein assembly factor BamB